MTLLWRYEAQAVHQVGDMHRCVWAPAPQMGAYLAQKSVSLGRRFVLTRLQQLHWLPRMHWLREKACHDVQGGRLLRGCQGPHPDPLPKGSIGHKEPVAAACR